MSKPVIVFVVILYIFKDSNILSVCIVLVHKLVPVSENSSHLRPLEINDLWFLTKVYAITRPHHQSRGISLSGASLCKSTIHIQLYIVVPCTQALRLLHT